MTEYFRTLTGAEKLSEANTLAFGIDEQISRINTVIPVKVINVESPEGEEQTDISDVTVDVQPQIKKVWYDGVLASLPPIFNVPVIRIWGNTKSAIVINPQVGDLGLVMVCQSDISAFISSKKISPPVSNRKYHFSDSLYLGGILNGKPTQYVLFNQKGIKIVSPTEIDLTAPVVKIEASTSVSVNTKTFSVNGSDSISLTSQKVDIKGETNVNGNLTVSGNVSSGGNVSDSVGKLSDLRNSYNSHTHKVSGVKGGGDTVITGAPNG